MKYIFKFSTILFFGMFCSLIAVAQNDDATTSDDLGDVTDAFQELFFEALKQKGIENHELALAALDKALLVVNNDPENIAVIYFEKGKNQAALKQYEAAEQSYREVLKSQPENLDVLEALYDVYYNTQDYEKAIPLVKKLAIQDEDYKEDLANLYNRTQRYDEALEILDELDASWGESVYRNALRRQIYKVTGNTEGAITNLEDRIDQNPNKEQDYLNLIFLYSEQDNPEKAFETAKELLAAQPNSRMVHFALYKFYLNEGNIDEALNSMEIVFNANEIDKESKYKVLADFIGFVNENPEYEDRLDTAIVAFNDDESGEVYEQLGEYYVTKNRKDVALRFYEKGVTLDPDNYSLIKNTLILQVDQQRYTQAVTLSEEALVIFPAQSFIYLINGVANNRLFNYDLAIESLETGLDFLLDEPRVERDFYEQLSIAHEAKGDKTKAANFKMKAAQIKLDN